MRAVVQRVRSAAVTVGGRTVGEIGGGLAVFLGVAAGDTEAQADWLAAKVAALRVFEDAQGKMNRSVRDAGGGVLAVPNFTVCGDCRHGRRPEFTGAARPETARPLFDRFVSALRRELADESAALVQTGEFGADMTVPVVNDGPVTLVIDAPPDAGRR